jgi:hypothetical protein
MYPAGSLLFGGMGRLDGVLCVSSVWAYGRQSSLLTAVASSPAVSGLRGSTASAGDPSRVVPDRRADGRSHICSHTKEARSDGNEPTGDADPRQGRLQFPAAGTLVERRGQLDPRPARPPGERRGKRPVLGYRRVTRQPSAEHFRIIQRQNVLSIRPTAVRVEGDLSVAGAKGFVQPHPTNPTQEIVYMSLEGGEAGTYARGTGRLSDGRAVIDLPEHFGLVTSNRNLTVHRSSRHLCCCERFAGHRR